MYFNEFVESYDKDRRERDIFHDLMKYRVQEILLVASLYDSFILESDGIISEQIYGEFYKLNLSAAPRISRAYTTESALEMFEQTSFDMVILMAGLDFDTPILLADKFKMQKPNVTIFLLAMNNSSLSAFYSAHNYCSTSVDSVFVWNGYSKLFIGMIKHVEDLHNVDTDTRVALVRVILLIEDSVRYYSRYLPLLYSVVMKQTQQLIEEELAVETYKILRMRCRPKILLATSYEEAEFLYKKYEPYLLTVISDVRFAKDGIEDNEAGFKFLQMTKSKNPDLPVLIQSSEGINRNKAYSMGAAFADKNSNSLAHELSLFFQTHLGFGPFIFRSPDGSELSRAKNIDEFNTIIHNIPEDSLLYHAERNNFSTWLMARGELRFARVFRNYVPDDFANAAELRDFIFRTLDGLQRTKSRGLIPSLGTASGGVYRLGNGSLGGKGRGIAFIKSLIDNSAFIQNEENMEIRLPYTAFIGIDEFERFMDANNLWPFVWAELSDSEVRQIFINGKFNNDFVSRLSDFLNTTNMPLAVRSSGLFEDMLMVPFSGVYETFIIPNNEADFSTRLSRLCDSIKLIYASLYLKSARAYFEAASYKIEEERMAVVVQELVGRQYNNWYFPIIAGTAQSYNYYPVSYLKPEDGLCLAAIGLGHYVVAGSDAYRFCPNYPKLDIIAPSQAESGQHFLYAIDMEQSTSGNAINLFDGEESTLSLVDISDVDKCAGFNFIASTWNIDDDRLEPGTNARGPRIINFAPALKYDAFPFASTVSNVLDICAKSMGTPVEIEYAINIDEKTNKPDFYLLQIKPLIQYADKLDIHIEELDLSECLLVSEKSMGNGLLQNVSDIVWVDPTTFDRSKTESMALEIEAMNDELKKLNKKYALIGTGRWGTRDRWLGIPVGFSQISNAKVIVEADLENFSVDSSLGSHFFHNVTSMNIGYMTVPYGKKNIFVDWAWLASLPIYKRGKYCVWTQLETPLTIVMDGKRSRAVIKKNA